MKLLINASNLHMGGGVQVAASFINELYYIDDVINVDIVVSSEVDANILSEVKIKFINNYYVVDIFGIKKSNNINKNVFLKFYDVCFTIFGPIYHKTNSKIHVTGFAQPWIAYPSNLAYEKLNLKEKISYKLNFFLKKIFFKRSDYFIVEQEHVKHALSNQGFSEKKIFTVSNCISSIYDDKEKWVDIDFKLKNKKRFTFGFIGRAYFHKNLDILVSVNNILLNKYNTTCNFLFTLTNDEMSKNGFDKLSNFFTVGEIDVRQCPAFYNFIDALIFPSLLECFSASPIEAMKMNKLVFASDLPFVKNICKDAAYYFDPMDPEDIAKNIILGINSETLNLEKIKIGQEIIDSLPSAKDRAINYLDVLKNI